MQNVVQPLSSCLVAIALTWSGINVACEFVSFGHYKMPKSAMEPTISSGESFIAEMSAYDSADPERWDSN